MPVQSLCGQMPKPSHKQQFRAIIHTYEMQKDQQLRRITGLTMLIILILNYAVLRFFTNTITPIAATAITTYIAIGVISPVFGDVAVVFADDVLLSDAEAFPLLDELFSFFHRIILNSLYCKSVIFDYILQLLFKL